MSCQCGEATGVHCPGTQEIEVRWVPPYLRGTAEAAGSWAGVAETLQVSELCAESLVDDWCEVVK